MKLTIRTLPELQRLKSFRARSGMRDVLIELPGAPAEIRKLEAQINKNLKACGCEIGAAFVAVGALSIGVFCLLAPNHFAWTSPKNLVGTLGFLGALALTGKIMGLAIANRRLQEAIRKIEDDASRQVGGLLCKAPRHFPKQALRYCRRGVPFASPKQASDLTARFHLRRH
ncbi:MAG TPA: hypothetical protein VN317_07300 [Candidatus Methanoperedens sp.]|nr:hypothetical protein [Candidatus Methanoperedens sp.]